MASSAWREGAWAERGRSVEALSVEHWCCNNDSSVQILPAISVRLSDSSCSPSRRVDFNVHNISGVHHQTLQMREVISHSCEIA